MVSGAKTSTYTPQASWSVSAWDGEFPEQKGFGSRKLTG